MWCVHFGVYLVNLGGMFWENREKIETKKMTISCFILLCLGNISRDVQYSDRIQYSEYILDEKHK